GSANQAVHRVHRSGKPLERNVGLAFGGLRGFDVDGAFYYIWRDASEATFLGSCDAAASGAACADPSGAVQQALVLDPTAGGSSVVVDRGGHRVFWDGGGVTYASS